MRAKPTPKERPETFHRIHVHFAKAVSVFIAGKLASPMVDTLMVVSPDMQASINALLVCINKCPWNDRVFDQGLDRLLLDIGQQIDDHLTTALHHPKDRWLFLLSCAPTRFAFASTATAFSPLVLHHLRMAFMAGNHIRFITLDLV
jgi:hypothetical protein